MTGTDWAEMQGLASKLSAEAARLSEDVDAAAAGEERREALDGDVTALSKIVRRLKRWLST